LRAKALRQTAGAELRVIADSLPERLAEAAAREGVRTTTSIEELVGSNDIDAVIVSTPPNRHRQQCEISLRNGKHVLCEKPLATTVEDCRSILQTAQRYDRTFGTGFNYRFYPAVIKARELIQAGRIGSIDHVKSFAGHPGGPEFTHQWVHDASIMGGGALMDNGIHSADLTLHFLGDVAEAQGIVTETVWQFRGSEDNGYLLMRNTNGKVGVLHASWTEWRGYSFHVDIYGTEGCIRLSYPPMLTILYDRPVGGAKRGRRHISWFPIFQFRERLLSYRWTVVQSFIAEQVDFMERIAGRPGVGATGIDGLRAVELVSSAYGRQSLEGPASFSLERQCANASISG